MSCGSDTTTLTPIGGADTSPQVDEPHLTPRTPEQSSPAEDGAAKESAPAPAAKTPEPTKPLSPASPAPGEPLPPEDPQETPPDGVFGDWCARMDVQSEDAYDICFDTAITYVESVLDDCAVSRLMSGWTRTQNADWGNYLIDYAYLFTGCPLLEEPPEGGLSVFGPAHLDDTGFPSPRLGRDDAQRLSAHFTDALVSMLGLTDSDRSAVELVLARSAEQQIDPSLSGVLSQCTGAADAGAGDAGP